MHWATASSGSSILKDAIREVTDLIRRRMQDHPIDLVLLFVSRHFASLFGEARRLARESIPEGVLIGCSAEGVIGGGREIEDSPGVALTAASLPDVNIHSFRLSVGDLPDGDASPGAWHEALGVGPAPPPQFLLLTDPLTFPAETLIHGLDYAFPRSVKIGGLASAAINPGGNALYRNEEMFGRGAVGVALAGNILVETVVSQGCRPIGKPLAVTKCRENTIFEIDGQKPLDVIHELLQSLTEDERRAASQSLFIGVVMNKLAFRPGAGDFLMRNLVAIDRQSGSITVGEYLRNGQTLQFHLRDAQASADDLDLLLDKYTEEGAGKATGALLFSCVGRGVDLYHEPDHDSRAFRNHMGDVPLGGFFCSGEIGPIGGDTYIHGYTSSFGIFRPAR